MADVKWSDNSAFPVATPGNTDYIVGLGGGGLANNKFLGSNFVLSASLAAGIATWLGAPSSANLLSAMTTKTGTGNLVFATSPTLVTPVLGVASATSINKVALTAPASGATLTIADGKTLTANNSLTLVGTDSTTLTFPTTSATIARTDAAQTFTGVQTFGTPIATASVATMSATVGGGVPTPPNNTTTFLRGDGTFAAPAGGGTPGGSDTQVQYNNAGSFGGISGATTNGTALTLVAPVLGTPASGTLTNCTIPVGGVSGLGTGVATWLATPTSANLATAVTDETGTGALVFGTNPTLTAVTVNAGPILTSGNFSAATWNGAAVANLVGVRLKLSAASYTDTTSTGTVALGASDVFGVGTILASSTTTFTNYHGVYFKDPVASTNVTMINKWSIGAEGSARIGGNYVSAATSGITFNAGSNTGFGLSASTTPAVYANNSIVTLWAFGATMVIGSTMNFAWSTANPPTVGFDLVLSRLTTANLRIGNGPSATPVANLVTVGEASRPGTDSNVGGANGTFRSGLGTGTGTASTLIFQTPVPAASGTGTQTYATQLTLGLSAVFGNAAIATTATDGFVYIPTCAGTPTGVPTTNTGRVAMVYDTTNKQFWIYDGAWLQPKTPAAAAIVNWQ